MALVRTYQGSSSSTSDATSYTFSAVAIGTGLAVVAASGNAAGGRTVSSITLDANAMADVISNASNNNVGSIRKRAFAAATGEVIVTFSSGMTRAIIHRYLLTGYDSETATDTATSVSASATSRSVTIDVPEQGAIIAAGGFDGAAQTTATWVGVTEDNDTDVEASSLFGAGSAQGLTVEVNRTVSITSDAASANDCHIVAASWGPARFVTADAGSYLFTGQAATFRRTYAVTANAGSYAFTGATASLEYGHEVLASAGAYTFTGQDVVLNRGKTVIAGTGSYSFTGTNAGLVWTHKITADAGSYAFTGASASLEYGREIAAASGSYVLTGADVNFAIADAPSIRLPVFGSWTVRVTIQSPTLAVAEDSLSPAVVSPSSNFATAPLRVMSSESIPLRVRAS